MSEDSMLYRLWWWAVALVSAFLGFIAFIALVASQWVLCFIAICLALPGMNWAYKDSARRKMEREFREMEISNAKWKRSQYNEYTSSLEHLKRNPGSADLRQRTLKIGRENAYSIAAVMGRNSFDEIALANDINAVCAGATGTPRSPAVEIEKLSTLCQRGVISPEEFERGKTLFLGTGVDKASAAVELLSNLHQLKMQGVLSESEFNMKKWDILSERLLPRKA